MGGAEALVVDELVFLVLPDCAFDVERRFCLGSGPAVAAAFDVVGIMASEQLVPRRRDLHAEKSPIFRCIEMMIERRIDLDRKSTRPNSRPVALSRMPS